MCRDFGPRKSTRVCPFRCFTWSLQGIAEGNLKSTEKNAFIVTLRRLAEKHELLPDRVKMEEKIVVSDEVHDYGGFGDVGPQMYMGRPVAVKTAKLSVTTDVQRMKGLTATQRMRQIENIRKTRKVTVNGIFAQT